MAGITPKEFEPILDALCKRLTDECIKKGKFQKAPVFENRVREVLDELLKQHKISVDFNPHPQIFPDIILGKLGVEVKFTTNDTWRSIANSIFEGTRTQDVCDIYVLFGKMGGTPEVRWKKYDECVIHVRTS